ncbi:hypothetical protein DUNSADRAFT_3411 [Dunaliella salina]|uniref:F-box domain-containing protein n=1 Tax=Dunaliella salina TaxID=3046 RepID=A0ABQ7GU11_DUNSA|nr:hypothetical protein DUNSADRAFT_3411 [Dunaliella salina]|eukprot:KAF5838102.1 hypothetical protein DUNSADRAFT_3411 [Dunaliella salina]
MRTRVSILSYGAWSLNHMKTDLEAACIASPRLLGASAAMQPTNPPPAAAAVAQPTSATKLTDMDGDIFAMLYKLLDPASRRSLCHTCKAVHSTPEIKACISRLVVEDGSDVTARFCCFPAECNLTELRVLQAADCLRPESALLQLMHHKPPALALLTCMKLQGDPKLPYLHAFLEQLPSMCPLLAQLQLEIPPIAGGVLDDVPGDVPDVHTLLLPLASLPHLHKLHVSASCGGLDPRTVLPQIGKLSHLLNLRLPAVSALGAHLMHVTHLKDLVHLEIEGALTDGASFSALLHTCQRLEHIKCFACPTSETTWASKSLKSLTVKRMPLSVLVNGILEAKCSGSLGSMQDIHISVSGLNSGATPTAAAPHFISSQEGIHIDAAPTEHEAAAVACSLQQTACLSGCLPLAMHGDCLSLGYSTMLSCSPTPASHMLRALTPLAGTQLARHIHVLRLYKLRFAPGEMARLANIFPCVKSLQASRVASPQGSSALAEAVHHFGKVELIHVASEDPFIEQEVLAACIAAYYKPHLITISVALLARIDEGEDGEAGEPGYNVYMRSDVVTRVQQMMGKWHGIAGTLSGQLAYV